MLALSALQFQNGSSKTEFEDLIPVKCSCLVSTRRTCEISLVSREPEYIPVVLRCVRCWLYLCYGWLAKQSDLWMWMSTYLWILPVNEHMPVNLNIYLLCSGACVVDCTCVMVDWPSSQTCKLNLWMWLSVYLWILPDNKHMPVNWIHTCCLGPPSELPVKFGSLNLWICHSLNN